MKLNNFDFRIYDIGNEYYMEPKFAFSDEVGSDRDNYEIELFTGRYDINGNKIYEGDILKCDNTLFCYAIGCYTDRIYKVVFSHHSFSLVNERDCLKFSDISLSSFEIIGNIHENEELLNVGL